MSFKDLQTVFQNVRWEHMAAGVTGGVLSTLVLHPLDLIKIRFQVNEGLVLGPVGSSRPQYQGIWHALKSIRNTYGVRGLYQGATPNVWGSGTSWGLYFLFYNTVKQSKLNSSDATTLPATGHMVAAAQAGVLTLLLTNPIWVAKTRICLQYEGVPTGKLSPQDPTHYRGMVDCLMKVYRTEGVRGLYRGLLPGMVGVSHGTIQFMTYEEMKKLYNGYRQVPLDTKFNSFEYIVLAALSKIVAASTTYPYQVVRSRLQDQHRNYSGVIDVIKQTWKYERVRGFYKGMTPYMVQCTPNICVVFLVYEHFINTVNQWRAENSAYHSIPPANEVTISSSSKVKDNETEGRVKDTLARKGSSLNTESGNPCNSCDNTVSCDCELLIECPLSNEFT